MELEQAKKRVEELRAVIEKNNRLYYDQDAPELEDFEYDALTRELKELEAQFPQLITATSPTQKVGGTASSKLPKVTHAVGVQHAAQPVVHIAAAGDEHDAGRAAVEPVDGVKNGVRAEIGGQRVCDRGVAAVIPAVHGHAGRLIEREQVGVFIQNVQRHGHGREAAAGALVVDAHGEGVPRRDAVDRSEEHTSELQSR